MADELINIDFEGLDEFVQLLENLTPEFEKAIISEMDSYRLQVEGGAKALTPEDTNELTESITSSEVQRVGNSFIFTVGSDLAYAVRMHEHQGNWGVGTVLKQAKEWRDYTPGNKFLENAVRGTEDDWNTAMEDILNNTLRGR